MLDRITFRLRRLGLKPIHLAVVLVLFLIYVFVGPDLPRAGTKRLAQLKTCPYEDYTVKAIDSYSSSVMSKINPSNPQPVNFDWNQFLDIKSYYKQVEDTASQLNCDKFSSRLGRDESTFYNCIDYPDEKDNFKFSLVQNMPLYMSPLNRKMAGKSYLAKVLPNPSKLVYLFHDNKVEVPVNREPSPEPLSGGNLQSLATEFTDFKQPIGKAYKPKTMKYEDFKLKDNLKKYKSGKIKELHEQYKTTKRAKKYFSEAFMLDRMGFFNIDWRFYNGSDVIDTDSLERNDRLAKLIRGWSNICEKYDITSWLTNLDLIGWHTNGLHRPFDYIHDYEVSIGDLLKLVDLNLNQSIIFDYSDINKGIKSELFLDISPFFTLRDRNNKENLIDIKLIDIETGLFISVYALSSFEYERLMNYKENPVFQSLEGAELTKINRYIDKYKDKKEGLLSNKNLDVIEFELFEKMIPVMYDNRVTYIPIGYKKIASEKYLDPFSLSKDGYRFREGIGIWVSNEVCKLPPFATVISPEVDLECLKKPEVKREYDRFKNAVKFHEQVLEELEKTENWDSYRLIPQDLTGFNYEVYG